VPPDLERDRFRARPLTGFPFGLIDLICQSQSGSEAFIYLQSPIGNCLMAVPVMLVVGSVAIT